MIGKRMTVVLLAALLVVSAVGAGGLPPSVLATDGSDGDDSRANATGIDVGSTANGTIEQGDVDWYAVEIESGQSIFANLTITTKTEKGFRFGLFNPDGEKIGEAPLDMMFPGYQTMQLATGNTAIGGDVAEQSGTYYVRVKPVKENVSKPTDYELTVETEALDQNDPNEEPATATRIEPNDTISGALSGSDRDTYAIDLEKGETITVTAEYDANGFGPYTYLVGPNASNVTLDPYLDREYAIAREPIGREHEFTYTANTTGTHFLRVNPYEEDATITTFAYESSYEISVDVSGSDKDDESDSDPPTKDDSDTPPEDSNENENQENESTEPSPDTDDSEQTDDSETATDDSEQTEQSDETGADEPNKTDAEDDTSADTSTDTEHSERSERGEEHTSDESNRENVDTSSDQSDC